MTSTMLEATFFKKGVLTTIWPIIFLFVFNAILTKLSQIAVLMCTTIWPSLVKIGLKTKKDYYRPKSSKDPFLKDHFL